ncbi:MAG: hypothetical protein R3D44_00460 [Hyphomicrobiaceae bacterium]
MVDGLRSRIEIVRAALAERPDGPRCGAVGPENVGARCDEEAWTDVLRLADGGRYGVIDVWSSGELPAYQDTPLPVGDRSEFLVVGQILYEPLVSSRASKDVMWLAHAYQTKSGPIFRFGQPAEFLAHTALGPGYRDLLDGDAGDDPWWALLRETGLA